ncbi:MAG: ABC transporter permease [Bacteroidales bacterium]|nr:ABC transporter permease [Bacteroidales bacterium]
MIINYIITAWRNLLKNRVVSLINIAGLTLGLSSAVLAILYARHELTFENSHEKADRLYRIYTTGDFGAIQRTFTTFGPVGQDLKNLFPEIEEFSISRGLNGTVRAGENIFNENEILVADSAFFSLFTIPFVTGVPSTDQLTVVISEKAAQRYFGDESPLGKSLNMNTFGEKLDFLVTGVFEDLPSNTHLKAEFIIPFSFADRIPYWDHNDYNGTNFNIYVYTSQTADYKAINAKILSQFKIPVELEGLSVILMPIKDIHMRGTWENNRGKLIGFLIGGLFVLITSCFNYINLTNILFSARARETGIRKVNGGNRSNVFLQFLADTVLSTLICYNLAIILIRAILPRFNALMDTSISIEPDAEFIFISLAIFVFTVILSGLYPAIRYSAMKPVDLMKPVSNQIKGKSYSRYLLTTFQFILAIIFIQYMMVMDKQNRHIGDVNVKGFEADNAICISGHPWEDLNKVKDELLKNPAVEYVSWGSSIPSMGYSITNEWKDDNNKTMAAVYFFEKDYLKLFSIKMMSGRFFSDKFASDKEDKNIIINRETAMELGYDDPMNKTVKLWGKNYTIIGVVGKYMAFPPIIDQIPIMIRNSSDRDEYLIIRISPEKRQETHEYITGVLKKFNSEYPVEIKYHQDILNDTKEAKSYITAGKLMNLFFILTIVASLIGLFGLSLFIAQRHRKEIGIRKACGASVFKVTFRLLKGLIIQVVIAISIATPIVYVASKAFLSIFPYRIEPGILFFLSGGGIALLLLIFTVSWQTWTAASRNPVESLRYE